jgi:hypothetical protein
LPPHRQDAPIITRIAHRRRYVTIHVHTVAASAAASAPARPAMCAGRRCASVERRLRPTAQPAPWPVWPAVGGTRAGRVARAAPRREARPQRAGVVPAGVVDAPLSWITPHSPRSTPLAGACLARAAAPRARLITVGHQSSPRYCPRHLPQ